MAFYDRLKEGRIRADLTQEQLAKKLGIAKSTLSGYESGKREPTIATIAKALNILDIDANFLYQDETEALRNGLYDLDLDVYNKIKKYRRLDTHGREMVDIVLDKEYDRCISIIEEFPSPAPEPLLYAAHERTDIEVTDEMRKHDDDIMNDDDF